MLESKEKVTLDPHDTEDEDQISHRFKSATTIEPIFSNSEQERRLKSSNANNVSCFLPNHSDENGVLVRKLPGINLPEKILFVIDTIREKNCTPFQLTTGAKYMPLFMIKRVVESFVCIKSTLQRSHEYAVTILNSQGARWICDFTNNTKCIINCMDMINEDILEDDQKSYDLGQMFEQIHSRLFVPPKKHGNEEMVPPFLTRVILLYSRSYSIPKFHTGKQYLESLTENPYFFIDVLYIHEPPSSENLCEEIYAELATLDTANCSYILEVGRNAAKVHDSMAKLLAHPLQRPMQKEICHAIVPSSSSQEMCTNV
ncbi:BRISC and BRCA1-A complex member 1-like [Hylaeus volcanicus]|uniref:BRISC and BRCA1-A complex member 1-like n=1 Tax=Hylaeus volcanicus TaxID=313075 RepID=UPI0023B7C269|nr:BRISC and BRCA1-A complex member 1-like [Hylaeus volcanicus]